MLLSFSSALRTKHGRLIRWALISALLAGVIGLAFAPQAFGDASALTLTNPADGSATNDATPTFSGTASTETGDATTVTVTVTGPSPSTTTVEYPATVQGDGSWMVDASADLVDGTYTAQARQVLADTTPAMSASHTFKVDLAPPASSATALPAHETATPFNVGYSASDATAGLAKVELWANGPNDGASYFKVAEDADPGSSGTITFSPTGGEGTYRFYTIATDKAGNVETKLPTAEATTELGPVASFAIAPFAPTTGQPVQFTSTSAAPSARSEQWDLGNDGTYDGNGSSFSHTFLAPGNYVVRLHVTDVNGGPPSDSVQVITIGDRPPFAAFLVTPGAPLTGDAVTFASTSSDPDDPIVSQAWDLDGDGRFGDAAGPTATTSFAQAGPHTVSLRVTDASGASATATQTVNVGVRPAPAPALLSPFPVVRIAGRVNASGAVLRLLTVQAPAGATVEVRCRGKGCPWKRKRHVAPGRAGDGRLKLVSFGGFKHRLRPGAVLEILVSKKGHVGKYTRFVIRRSKAPKRTDSCLMPGRSTPRRCPAS